MPANKGLGNARNVGMKFAKGDYEYFVDSDDWLRKDACEKMLFRIQESSCDVCMCGYQCFQMDGQIVVGTAERKEEVYFGKTLLADMLAGKISFSCAVWQFLYKRELICDLLFDSDIFYEDVNYTTICLLKNPKIAVEPELLYYYRMRDSSITHQTVTDKHVRDRIKVAYDQAEILRGHGYLKYVERSYYLNILGLKTQIYQSGRNRKHLKQVKEALKWIPIERRKLKRRDRIVIDVFQYAMPLYFIYRTLKLRWNIMIPFVQKLLEE